MACCPDCASPQELPDPHQVMADLAVVHAMRNCDPDSARAFTAAQWTAACLDAGNSQSSPTVDRSE
jgi:hypothetical protein